MTLPTYDKNDPGTYLRAALAVLDQNAVRSTKQPAAGDIDQARAWIQTALSLLPAPVAPSIHETITEEAARTGRPEGHILFERTQGRPWDSSMPATVPALRPGASVRIKAKFPQLVPCYSGQRGTVECQDGEFWLVTLPECGCVLPFHPDSLTVLE